MLLTLEIFGPFHTSSVPGLWRGLVASALIYAVLLAVNSSKLLTTTSSLLFGNCAIMMLTAVVLGSALSVLQKGTPSNHAALYGALVGVVVGVVIAVTKECNSNLSWSQLLLWSFSTAVIFAGIAAVTYWTTNNFCQ